MNRNKRIRNPKQDIEIDLNCLEDEVIEHPSLYLHYSEKYADAVEEKDIAKQKAELKYAQVESNLRQNWDLHFEAKPTEPALKAKIIQDKGYQEALNRLNKANKTVNVFKGIVTSFEHRKKALESAISLRIGGFYSEPKPKRQIDKGEKRQRPPLKKFRNRKQKKS